MINPTTVLSRCEGIITSSLDGNAVMMSLENGKYYGTEPVASAIWTLLEQPITFADLVEKLLEEFNVSKEQCQADTQRFVQQLCDEGLITIDK